MSKIKSKQERDEGKIDKSVALKSRNEFYENENIFEMNKPLKTHLGKEEKLILKSSSFYC